MRKTVLEILVQAHEPLSAATVLRIAGSKADQVTVYRTLHYLEENGYADSFVLHCTSHGTERYYSATIGADGTPATHSHWFHCEQCHRFIDLGTCTIHELVTEYEREYGIEVRTHTLYLTGICPNCRAN
jgi:Fur family ferric uptake transcriptional regulator